MGQAESTEISTPNKTRVVRVLSAHHATFQGRQSKDFPKGWMSKFTQTCFFVILSYTVLRFAILSPPFITYTIIHTKFNF